MPNLAATFPGPGAAEGDATAGDQDRHLAIVFQIARLLVAERDVDTMLLGFLDTLIEAFDAADGGLLLLHDPLSDTLSVRAARGYELGALSRLHLARGESMSGQAFDTGEPLLFATRAAVAQGMATLSPANRAAFDAAAAGMPHPHSAVCIPLTSSKRKVGVLVLENLRQEDNAFTSRDLAFLQHVADLITLSIENAALKDELQAAQAHSEANRLKAELISTLAHEMRTPLTSIKGYSTALLMDDATFSPETQREFLQIIDEETDILQDLIHDLLESSMIDAGFLKLDREPVSLPRLVHGVVEDIARRNQEHRFLVDFPPNFPILEADPHRVVQVLRNLLDNAVKYSQNGGLVVVTGEVRADEAVISVADQGMGIAPEHLNHLFEKFFRIKSGIGRHVVGVGLGLPIARTIVENHGGRIWAESQLGQGTTFYFTLPITQNEEEEEAV